MSTEKDKAGPVVGWFYYAETYYEIYKFHTIELISNYKTISMCYSHFNT